MNLNKLFKLIVAVSISGLAGIIGSVFTMSAIQSDWYAALAKPAFNPPAWVFGPVWAVLYFLMGVSAWLVWKGMDYRLRGNDNRGSVDGRKNDEVGKRESEEYRKSKIALIIFDIQLVLNVFWSVIFFGLRNPGGAFVEIIFLWLAIIATIILFAKISRPAAWLLIPYIMWVSFAGYLNFSIWQFSRNDAAIACTLEAKLCPDSSAVGRTGPNCEFAPCPSKLMDDKTAVEKYLRENIKMLAPEEPVLGGNWYVVSVDIDPAKNIGTVVYEDGHIQEKASFHYSRTNEGVVVDSIEKR